MENVKIGRRERRRRMAGKKSEGNESAFEFEKTEMTVENVEHLEEAQSFKKLVRRDTYTVLHSKKDFENDMEEESCKDSTESKNVTYSLGSNQQTPNNNTYVVDESIGKNEFRPIPAPRKLKQKLTEQERPSSDTDRDITEIDLDDFRLKSPRSETNSMQLRNSSESVKNEIESESPKSEIIMAPVPKPRTTVKNFEKANSNESTPKNEHLQSSVDSLHTKLENFDEKSNVSNPKENLEVEQRSEVQQETNQLPLLTDLQSETKLDEIKQTSKKQEKIIGELFDLKGKKNKNKSKTFSSFMKLEKKKIPKISSILKELKEEGENKEFKREMEDEKIDFQIESPHYTESAENGQIYVQSKNGFRLMERDEIFRNGITKKENNGNGGMLEDSTVKTAILFQKYWSRFMIYFHGLLAGFGFCHAATVTAIMLHYNYEPQGFMGIYSCLSLKFHYVFYTLTALCIVSCFDRVDIGHMNRRHWETAWKVPSMWAVLCIYLISIVLTFSNQITESRFDAHPNANETELWNTESQSDIQVGLLQWYHTIWARDMLVLLAWLIISLTKFSDFLHSHIVNMTKYTERMEKDGERSFHHMAGPKGDYL